MPLSTTHENTQGWHLNYILHKRAINQKQIELGQGTKMIQSHRLHSPTYPINDRKAKKNKQVK